MSITGELSEGGPSRHSEPVGDGCRRHHDATATSVPAAVTAKEAAARLGERQRLRLQATPP